MNKHKHVKVKYILGIDELGSFEDEAAEELDELLGFFLDPILKCALFTSNLNFVQLKHPF